MRSGTIALVAVMSLTAAAAADPPAPAHRVAIVASVEVNVDAVRAEALTGTLADAVRAKLQIDALGGADVSRRLPPGGLPDDCVAQPACIAQLGARLEADQLLFLVIVQVGHTIQLDPTWADVATGKTIARPRLELDDDARAGKVFGDDAQKLLPDVPLRPSSTQTVVIREGADTTVPHHMTTASWATGGVAVAALGASVGFAFATRSAYDDCNHADRACTDAEITGVHHKAIAADSLGALAIAAGVATAVLYFRSGGETIAVTPAPGGGVVTLGGRF